MERIFLQLDFLGPTSIIYINGNKRYKSIFGAILSSICFIIIIIVCVFLFLIYIENKEYIINQYLENNGNFSFKMNNNSIRFKILDNYNNIINKKILDIIPFYYNKNEKDNIIQLNTTSCNLNDLKNYSKYINNLDNNDYICISDTNEINLTITYNETNTSFLFFYIAKCINTTENNNHCLTNEQIESYILKTNIKLLTIIDNNIINYNQYMPVNPYPYIRELNVVQDLFYQYNFNYKKILFKKDEGFILKRYSKKDLYMLDIVNSNYNVYGMDYQSFYPNSLISIKIGLNNDYIHIYEISFSKFQNCFTNMVGLSFLIYKIFYFINFLFQNGKMFTELMDINYIIDSNNQLDNKVKKNSSKRVSFQLNNNHNNLHQSTNQILNNSNSMLNIPVTQPINNKPLTYNHFNDYNQLTKKKNITLCDSFRYHMKFLNLNNNKIKYILTCERITKNIINTENIIKKNFQLDIIFYKKKFNFNLSQVSKSNSISDIKSPTSIPIKKLKSQKSKNDLDLKNSNFISIIKEEDEK